MKKIVKWIPAFLSLVCVYFFLTFILRDAANFALLNEYTKGFFPDHDPWYQQPSWWGVILSTLSFVYYLLRGRK